MSRQPILFSKPNAKWLKQKVEVKGVYRSNSEAVSDLIRKARKIDVIRGRLIEAEQCGFSLLSRNQIRAEFRDEMRRDGEWPD